MSKLEVDAIEPQSGTTITIGASGDTVNLVGTLKSNGSPLPGDISEVVAGTGLSGGGTTGAVTINIDSAQPTITSLGTINSFRSTGIDDNSNALAITIDSSEHTHFGSTSSPSAGQGGVSILNYGTIQSSRTATGNLTHSEFYNPNGQVGNIKTGGSDLNINASSSLTFYTNNAEKMRVLSSGFVGIGTSNPSQKLEVSGTNNIIQDNKTSTSTGIAGIQLKGSDASSYLKVFHLGPSFGGTTFGGVTGNNQSLIEAQGVSSLAFTTQGGTPDIIFAPARTARMTIKNDGKVGIGTSSPASTLEISKSDRDNGCTLSITNSHIGTDWSSGDVIGTVNFRVDDTSTSQPIRGQIVSFDDGSGAGSAAPNDSAMKFSTASSNTLSERMRITSAGRVGIGTAAPAATLEVMGTTGANFKYDSSSTYLSILPENAGGDVALRFRANAGDAPDLLFKNDGGSEIVRIGNTGNVGIGTSNTTTAKVFVNHAGAVDDNGLYVYSNLGQTVPLVKVIQDGAGSSAPAVYIRNDDADGIALHLERGDSSVTPLAFANQLFIEDNANSGMTIGSPTSGVGTIAFADSGNAQIGKLQYRHDQNSMLFTVNAAERMRIDSAGRILINTTSHIGTSPYLNIASTYTNSGMAIKSNTANAHHAIEFHNTNGQVGSINTSGSSTVYNTSSDYRLKENVSYDFDATTRLKQLKPARFNFIADADTTVDGFIAHEVQSIIPEAISGEKDAVNEDGSINPQGIDQSKLVPLLVKTIQELEARITTLENA